MAARMLFASRNDGKARELGPLLREHGISLLSLRDVGIAAVSGEDTIECFDTFEDNALVERAVSGGCVVQVAIGAEGFGYDSYFRSTELGVTFGEAGVALKNRISHRGRAFRTLLTTLLNDPACAAWFGANGG
jgi:inosine/xanthosine triphosphate pyrophosphatase family protein